MVGSDYNLWSSFYIVKYTEKSLNTFFRANSNVLNCSTWRFQFVQIKIPEYRVGSLSIYIYITRSFCPEEGACCPENLTKSIVRAILVLIYLVMSIQWFLYILPGIYIYVTLTCLLFLLSLCDHQSLLLGSNEREIGTW